jgi:hypothetical protein
MSESTACIHHILEGNIHEFILTAPSRRTVDELLAIVDTLNSEVASSGGDLHRYILVDSTKGLPPINYTFAQMGPLARKYPQQRATVALISQPNFLLTTITIMMRAISPVRFYKPDEREQALAWLRETAAKR